MSREVKAFACQFNCRRNVLISRKRMDVHEARCFYNPAKRACVTCKHFMTEWEEQYMSHQFGEAVYGKPYKTHYCAEEIDLSVRLVSDCALWSQR